MVLHLTVWALLVGVILVIVAILLVVKLLGVLPGLAFGLLAVDVVGTFGLSELVDLTTGETGNELLGEGVGDWLACWRRG